MLDWFILLTPLLLLPLALLLVFVGCALEHPLTRPPTPRTLTINAAVALTARVVSDLDGANIFVRFIIKRGTTEIEATGDLPLTAPQYSANYRYSETVEPETDNFTVTCQAYLENRTIPSEGRHEISSASSDSFQSSTNRTYSVQFYLDRSSTTATGLELSSQVT